MDEEGEQLWRERRPWIWRQMIHLLSISHMKLFAFLRIISLGIPKLSVACEEGLWDHKCSDTTEVFENTTVSEETERFTASWTNRTAQFPMEEA